MSIVTYPAYPTTEVGLRSLQAQRPEHPKNSAQTRRIAFDLRLAQK